MKSEEFYEKQAEVLKQLPIEFQSFAEMQAWDQGHSAGYEEVLNYVEGYVYDLMEPIAKYTERIKNENKK
jgi:hypothetical protein